MAGYQEVTSFWGITLTLKQMSNFNPFIEERFLEMSAYEFLINVQIKNNLDHCDKEYQKLLNKK